MTDRLARARAAEAAVNKVIEEYRDVFAPDSDPEDGSWCTHSDACSCRVASTVVLTEFVVLMDWTDLEHDAGGDNIITVQSQENMKRSHVLGLMQMGVRLVG